MCDVITRYLDCWNETDPGARRKLIEDVWAAEARYTDPLGEAYGRDAIDATIAAVQDQFPGFVFSLAGPVDAHHRQARFTWSLGPEGAEPLVVGFDVAVTDEDGKIVTVLGFLDQVPG
jgi:SnoaL-like domain